ncbi:hypothetical protein Pmani_011389 [Petrolisthes manimaculis]|uniref:VASt domain-containing protein n=1 Tax=Petrolisthes manimaculis TaxID=1843537 RepID=A0AAE1Q175_9EUCA|nr:hypothetical protein Pmani_011389 [Petrolisthes manimaculis]
MDDWNPLHQQALGSSGERDERSPSFLTSDNGVGVPSSSRPVSRATSLTHLNHTASFTHNSSESGDEPHFSQPTTTHEGGGGGGVGGGGGATSCPKESQHQGKELLNTVVALPIEAVFNFLFTHDQFMVDVYSIKKTYDVVPSPWEKQEDGAKGRVVTYTMALPPSNLGPKVSYISEKQIIQPETQPGDIYVVELEANNTGIPYADSFYVFSHYCITREEDNRTRLTVWVQVKYKKTVWGFMKGVIEKSTYNGVEALLAEIAVQLTAQADRIANPKAAIRRRRRTNADKTRNTRHTPSSPHSQSNNENTSGVGWFAVLVLALVAMLVAANVVLYKRLSILEYNSAPSFTQTNPPATRVNVAGSWETVARILQRQEDLHRYQLDQWKEQLERASQTLAQVEGWLQDIIITIPQQEKTLREALEHQSKQIYHQVWPHNSPLDSHTWPHNSPLDSHTWPHNSPLDSHTWPHNSPLDSHSTRSRQQQQQQQQQTQNQQHDTFTPEDKAHVPTES